LVHTVNPHAQEVAVVTVEDALARVKGELAQLVPASLVRRLAAELPRDYRDRTLPPVTTAYLALRKALHNTAAAGLRHLAGVAFTPSAYCQARGRLPVGFFARLAATVTGRLRTAEAESDGDRWCGRRTWLIDGSSFSMPDTPDLQAAFGQPAGQAAGCGFPVAHLLALFEAGTGYLVRALAAPLRTHDLAGAAATHTALAAGDVLVGDRAFASYAHLALLRGRGLDGVFRLHQRRRAGRRRDRGTTYVKPAACPAWMAPADYAALPPRLELREVRVRVTTPGRRVRTLTLVTTLLDAGRFPAADLARLYESRWQVEVNLRHLKQTLGSDVLRSQTETGVLKELLAFVAAYNLVRRVMRQAARQQGVPANRVSFVDALRWLRQAAPGAPVPPLVVNPQRPGRVEPRTRKRRPKQYDLMNRPREELRQRLLRQPLAA
jgi:hypothetical protein